MSTDWIKMRVDLREDPAVFRLAKLTKLDRLSVVGRLWAFWSWADKHAVHGQIDGADAADVDEIADKRGFASALVEVGWLSIGDGFVAIPKHDRHTGESAKERSLKNARQARWRQSRDADVDASPSTSGDASPSTDPSTREEKRREEIRDTDAIASAAAKSPRATRKCPKAFEPKDAEAWIAHHAPGVDWRRETEAFRDYTFKNAITDWDGCWRNWMRKATPAGAARGFQTAKERDRIAAETRVRDMTGGLLDRAFPQGEIIEMETSNAAQIRGR